MKPYKLLLIISFIAFSTSNIFAQNNEMKARIEYEDAETAFQNKEYEKAINYLTNSEKLLGKWTPKVSFLKIQALDIVTDYSADWNDNMAELYRQVKEYMKYANKNADKVDIDKMREIYAIEKRIDDSKQIKDWIETEEFKKGTAAYEKGNYEEAISWHKKAADKGNGYSMVVIGWYYVNGKGVEQNYQEAMTWYKKAAEKGGATAMFYIGYLYDNGQGVTKNYQEAMTWYRKAADKGNAPAMAHIGYLYDKGKGVTQNYQEAMIWYKKAVDKGDVSAMVMLGSIYRDRENYQEAISWYEKALNVGFSDVGLLSYAIGIDYYRLKKYSKAMEWFKKAYSEGNTKEKQDAKFWIAKMYEEGLGVEKDKKKAKEWRSK